LLPSLTRLRFSFPVPIAGLDFEFRDVSVETRERETLEAVPEDKGVHYILLDQRSQ